MKKFRKKISGIIAVCCILSTSIVAYARDTDWTIGRSFTWSPYVSSTETTSYSTSLRARIDFFFDKDGADKNNKMYYFTMEEHCGDGKKLILGNQYTNIPNPHFDGDDDDGDGYEEESEVVEGGNSLTSSTTYYFTTWWDKDDTTVPGGTMSYTAQNSIYNPFDNFFDGGEYEAYNYDLLAQDAYSAIGTTRTVTQTEMSSASISAGAYAARQVEVLENDMFIQQIAEDPSELEITIDPSNNSANIEAYKEYQISNIAALRNNMVSRTALSSEGQATITFAKPISKDTVLSIMRDNNALLLDCELKLVNAAGTWITANVKNFEDLDIEELVDRIASETGEIGLTYCGVTSARVLINVADSSYEDLSSNENIYFVDLMDYILRNEYSDYTGKLDIRVFDLAWSIMN